MKNAATGSEILRRVETLLRDREPRYVELLRRMVEINSFTANHPGIDAVAELTAGVFAALGFDARRVPAKDPAFAAHLLLHRPARRETKNAVALVSHLDTVFPPEEETRNDFRWREEGDRLYGPGTVDIKGGTIVAYAMLDTLATVAPEMLDAAHWLFFLNSAEEQMATDFGPLCIDAMTPYDPLACLLYEGGLIDDDRDFRLVVARKGRATFEVVVEGRGSHAGSAHPQGANAIVQLAEAIERIASWTDYDRELTWNVGAIGGGTVINRVPHHAWARVEMRVFDREVYAEALARVRGLERLATVRAADGYPCRVRIDDLFETPSWPRNERTDRLLAIWQRTASALGWRGVAEERGGLSDGNYLWHALPCLDGLGAAGANAHCSERSADGAKDQEYALRSSLTKKALLNTGAVLRLLDSA